MTRREFITLLGGAAAAWPLVARAQQSGGSADRLLAARFLSREPAAFGKLVADDIEKWGEGGLSGEHQAEMKRRVAAWSTLCQSLRHNQLLASGDARWSRWPMACSEWKKRRGP